MPKGLVKNNFTSTSGVVWRKSFQSFVRLHPCKSYSSKQRTLKYTDEHMSITNIIRKHKNIETPIIMTKKCSNADIFKFSRTWWGWHFDWKGIEILDCTISLEYWFHLMCNILAANSERKFNSLQTIRSGPKIAFICTQRKHFARSIRWKIVVN